MAAARILLVNQHTVPVFTDVVNVFATHGHRTLLFTGHIEKGRVAIHPAVRVVNSKAYSRRTTFTRLTSWIAFSVHYLFYLLLCRKPTSILVVSNPPMAPFVTALVAALRRIPFHIVVFDLYPEALQQAGLSSGESPLFRWWQRNNRWTFARARSIITLSESMKTAVTNYVDAGKVRVIPNWADIEYITPVPKERNPFLAKHSIIDKRVVLYSGNMGLTHDLESVIEAARLLSDDTRVVFVLIGEGGKRKTLQTLAEGYQLSNVRFLPYQDADDFPLAMAAGDIGIVTLGSGAEGISVPSKTYVNMAAGLAIIAISPLQSELNRIVERYEVGYLVAPGQAHVLAERIRSLLSDPILLDQFKQRSREASVNFTPATAAAYLYCVDEC